MLHLLNHFRCQPATQEGNESHCPGAQRLWCCGCLVIAEAFTEHPSHSPRRPVLACGPHLPCNFIHIENAYRSIMITDEILSPGLMVPSGFYSFPNYVKMFMGCSINLGL